MSEVDHAFMYLFSTLKGWRKQKHTANRINMA